MTLGSEPCPGHFIKRNVCQVDPTLGPAWQGIISLTVLALVTPLSPDTLVANVHVFALDLLIPAVMSSVRATRSGAILFWRVTLHALIYDQPVS